MEASPASPCRGCEHEEEDKRNDRCENCPERLQFMREYGGLTAVETMARDIPVRKRDVVYCSKCPGIHYAKGLCRSCYYKDRYVKGKDARKRPAKSTVTLHFNHMKGGKDILAALQEVSFHEDRAVTKQAIRFICEGLLRWYNDHAD